MLSDFKASSLCMIEELFNMAEFRIFCDENYLYCFAVS